MRRLGLMMLGVLLAAVVFVAPGQTELVASEQPAAAGVKTVMGTIEGIDPVQRIVMIQSEDKQGELRLLAFRDEDAVRGLTKGDRVQIELDDRGMATKIVKAASAQQGTADTKP